jgi:hypothetical protein
MFRKWTIRIIAVVTLACIAWDLVAYAREENSTFSVVFTDWSFYTPWIPFVWGFLMGHWFAAPVGSKKEQVG